MNILLKIILNGICFYLNCFHNRQMAWVHYGGTGSAVLSVGSQVLTTNNRVTVTHERNTWILVIVNATVKDRGQYMCQISTVPPKKMYATLQVQVPPKISIPPNDVTVTEGENVTLECDAIGDPTPQVTWRSENSGRKEWHGRNLTLHHVTRKDAKAYLCVASNGVPPAVSARAKVIVLYAPVIEYDKALTLWASRGSKFDLACDFWSMPQPDVLWEAMDKATNKELEIRTEFDSDGEGKSQLLFNKVTDSDFGSYKCSVKNKLGKANVIFLLIEKLSSTSTSTTTMTTVVSSSIETVTTTLFTTTTELIRKNAINFSKGESIDRIIRRYLRNNSLPLEDIRPFVLHLPTYSVRSMDSERDSKRAPAKDFQTSLPFEGSSNDKRKINLGEQISHSDVDVKNPLQHYKQNTPVNTWDFKPISSETNGEDGTSTSLHSNSQLKKLKISLQSLCVINIVLKILLQ